ncbi:hypothetical protein NDU88_001713 [Pleurodeles waltl]|uniref:Uncharacterized protein n=1 Tax=Pleurodeles waltl TaxID=8319 RepID=A0AAV7UUU9_PLEWA|nr:hypothetical protein NDU88_001713 [Pleurodeles waltl]
MLHSSETRAALSDRSGFAGTPLAALYIAHLHLGAGYYLADLGTKRSYRPIDSAGGVWSGGAAGPESTNQEVSCSPARAPPAGPRLLESSVRTAGGSPAVVISVTKES